MTHTLKRAREHVRGITPRSYSGGSTAGCTLLSSAAPGRAAQALTHRVSLAEALCGCRVLVCAASPPAFYENPYGVCQIIKGSQKLV
jgi:hypothetical protein